MAKKIDLTKTVYELTKEYPELVDIMAGLGFKEITRKPVLNSLGKITTIPKGAKMKGIPMMDVVTALITAGFQLEGEMPVMSPGEPSIPAGHPETLSSSVQASQIVLDDFGRTELLKSYLKRLGDGEDLESVRADFVENFQDVEASEIMAAEQELMKEGTPITELQKLCDLHSALFHGATREEKIANAEKAVNESVMRQKVQEEIAKRDSFPKRDYSDKKIRAAELEQITGHPLQTFTKENDVLSRLLEEYKSTGNKELLSSIRQLSTHYAAKGDLIYPLLKVKYGVSGPSDIMWTVDDEIRDDLGKLFGEKDRNEDWNARLNEVLTRAEEMVYKEQNILFPICAVNFTEEEWFGIYRDSKDYDICFGIEPEIWDAAEAWLASKEDGSDKSPAVAGEVVMPGGHMTVDQLTALLNTIPLEITFVDADNINRFFNEGPKVFKRPGMAIDRDVFSCHPPKIEPMVRGIIEDFRSGRRDSVPIWMEKGGKTMLVTYMAVRDKQGNYLGTVELVQDMEFAKEHFLKVK